MVFKQLLMQVRGDGSLIPVSVRLLPAHKELLRGLGSGNINAGIGILMATVENDIKRHLKLPMRAPKKKVRGRK
jgi:hypothetical protein